MAHPPARTRPKPEESQPAREPDAGGNETIRGLLASRQRGRDGQGTDFQRFYREMAEPERLQLSKHEVDWLQRFDKPTRNTDVVLSFGCGVQTVPHIMLTQVAVCKALGIDFVATAGQAYCCGSPLKHFGKPEAGVRTAHLSIRRFAAWQPRVNVHQCGQCYIQFAGHVADIERETGTRPFEVVHITKFLLDTLRDRGDAVSWRPTAPRRRVLLHAEGSELHITKQEAREAIIETLALIPGVEYVGLVEEPSIGSPCGTTPGRRSLGPTSGTKPQNDITSDEYRQAQAELEAQASAVGADAIVTPHHKCHREWSKLGSERLPVLHYTSVLAEALGITIPDRFQILWRVGDVDQIMEMTRPQWESWGITPSRARQMVLKYFVPEYAEAVQQCPCDGNCFETVITPDVTAPARSSRQSQSAG